MQDHAKSRTTAPSVSVWDGSSVWQRELRLVSVAIFFVVAVGITSGMVFGIITEISRDESVLITSLPVYVFCAVAWRCVMNLIRPKDSAFLNQPRLGFALLLSCNAILWWQVSRSPEILWSAVAVLLPALGMLFVPQSWKYAVVALSCTVSAMSVIHLARLDFASTPPLATTFVLLGMVCYSLPSLYALLLVSRKGVPRSEELSD